MCLRNRIASLWLVLVTGLAWSAFGQSTSLFSTIHNNPTGSAPLAVATGDFNGDGIPDMAVTNSGGNSVSVLIGYGDGNFNLLGAYPVGVYPAAIVTGDFNHDGNLDLAIVNSNPNKSDVGGSVSILLGRGNGDFVLPAASYGVGFVPTALAVGDFDGDGNPDLAVVVSNPNAYFNPGYVTLLMGKPDGTFQVGPSYAAGIGATSIAAGDFNGDGKVDLAVGAAINGNVFNLQSEVTILLNNGSGGFSAGSSFNIGALGTVPLSIAAADFDNDGRLDLAVAIDATNNILIARGNGDGTFTPVTSPTVGTDPYWVTVADLDSDGKPDLIVANHGDSTISVLRGNGDETFTTLATYAVGNSPTNVAVADFNGDGKLDVAVVNNGENIAQVFLGEGGGGLRAGSYGVGSSPYGIASGDFNHDGLADFAVLRSDASVAVFLADGHGGFQPLPAFPVLVHFPGNNFPCPRPSLVIPIVAGDFDENGTTDLAVSCGNAIVTFEGNGDGTFTFAANFEAPEVSQEYNFPYGGLSSADLTGGGFPEILVSSGFVSASNLMQFGSVLYDSPCALSQSVAASDVAGDFNGDGKVDLLDTNPGCPFAALLGDGAGNFQPITLPETGVGSVVGDFNGDGLSDFAYLTSTSGSPGVITALSNGDGTFSDALAWGIFVGTSLGGVADFNGDGIPDVLALEWNAAAVLLGQGDGTYSAEVDGPYYPPEDSPHRTAVISDFDGNGSPDVAVLDPDAGSVFILLNNRGFQPTTTALAESPGSVVAGQPITLSATVAGKQATPTGSVQFKESGVPQATVSLNNGSAQTSLNTPLAAGLYGYTALYTGDTNFGGSISSRRVLTVRAASTITVVSASSATSRLGQSVSFTATITPQYTGAPTGTVQFYADGEPIGVGALSGAQATVITSALPMGTYTIEADYSGDSGFTTSLGLLRHVVGKAASTVALSSSANPAAYGAPPTLTATVTDSDGLAPSGTVVFSEGGNVYGTIPLSGGVAQIVLPTTLAAGKHSITAQYSGDSSDGPAKASFAQVITGATTTTTITTDTEPSTYGQTVTFTAVVSSAVGTPDGTVTFKNGSAVLGTVGLNGGQAAYAIGTLNGGTHTIKAVYNGSSTYGLSSASVSQVVERAASTTTLTSSLNPAPYGQTVTFIAVVTSAAPAAPSGTVTIKDGKKVLGSASLVNGQMQISTSLLATGSHTLTATYAGSANFSGSSGSLSQAIQ